MKKKCTNSTCRRTFSCEARRRPVVCPYCGKTYARLGRKSNFMVYDKRTGNMQDLTEVDNCLREGKRVAAIRYMRQNLGWHGLKECKAIVDRIQATGCYPLTYDYDHIRGPVLTWPHSKGIACSKK